MSRVWWDNGEADTKQGMWGEGEDGGDGEVNYLFVPAGTLEHQSLTADVEVVFEVRQPRLQVSFVQGLYPDLTRVLGGAVY